MKKLLVFGFVFGFLFWGKLALAADFATSFDLNYKVFESGKTTVTQYITLTNQSAKVYATKYSLFTGGEFPTEVSASDKAGSLPVIVEKDGEGGKITVNLRDVVVGVGNSQNFNVSYELSEIATRTGRIWQVNIPQTKEGESDQLKTTVSVPVAFGEVAFVSPTPLSSRIEGGERIFVFPQGNEAIVAAFGEFQIFDFKLTYHLKNPDQGRVYFDIALPPDTNYQKIFIEELSREPEDVTVDENGNWLARYILSANEDIDIVASGYVYSYANPQPFPVIELQPERFLEKSEFWQTDDPEILKAAERLTTPREIYEFVVDKLEYDFEKINKDFNRLGASQALKEPTQAACQEFTDLFVAISRAAGIPAREINGYGYTTNTRLRPLSLVSDVLHAWPEYYDEGRQIWVQVDPTWEDTTGGQNYFDKLDTSHIAFAIHGLDPDYPRPAGDYKYKEDVEKRDVEITLGHLRPTLDEKVDVRFLLPWQMFFKLPMNGRIEISNASTNALYNLDLTAQSGQINISNPRAKIPVLPPFGKEDMEAKFAFNDLLVLSQPELAFSVRGEVFSYRMGWGRYILSQSLIPGLILSLGIIIWLLRRKRHGQPKSTDSQIAGKSGSLPV